MSALARRLNVDWHTLWEALKVEAQRWADDPDRPARSPPISTSTSGEQASSAPAVAEFRDITSATLDPFRGYANALRDSLSDAVQVSDAFHVVKLGTQVVDEVRRRVQQERLGRARPS